MADSLASQIITAIGGPENVRSLTHCATRLRFELVDASKVDQNSLEHMQGVLGAVPQSGDRFQVVIGGGVATVYENIMHLPEMAGVGGASASDDGQKSNADVKAEARSKARGKVAWLDSFFEYLSDSFRPILGVLLGASIIIALVNLLISLNVIPNDEASAGWVFVKAIWKGVFYFLPIMVAYNASKKLKVDPWLGGAIMAMLMTPQFTSLMDAKTTTCVENAALGTKSCTANIFGIPMALSDYSGNVFVPLLMAAVLALVYHGLKRIIPESVQLVFVPFFCMIIVGALTAFIIGPIGVWVGNGLGVGLAWMNTHAPFIFAIIIPMLYPFLVPLGLHWPLNALMLMNIQTLGYDFIQGPMGVWNFACFGATAGVLFLAVRDKDKDMRQTALGALAAGLLGGVSEPSLYGIHLRYKLIYKRMLVGCGLGGVVIAILGWLFPSVTAAGQTVHGVTTTAFAFTSLLTIPVFNQMWVYAVSIAVSFLTSFLLIITFDYRTPEQKAEVLAERLRDINPGIGLTVVDKYIKDEETYILLDAARYDYVVDAIDTLSPKLALIAASLERGLPLVSSMGAGAKTDPTKLEIADISKTHHCPLAHMLRKRLHKIGIRRGFRAVFSPEPMREGAMILCEEQNKKSNVGTISYIPALFGIGCASVVIRDLIGELEG